MRTIRITLAAVATMLLLAGCGSSSDQADTTATTAAGAAGTVTEISLTDFMIAPTPINVKAGPNTFRSINDGKSPHNFYIKASEDGADLGGSEDLAPGETGDLTLDLKPGTYVAYCEKSGHESLGMKATLTVS